jgi:hypothetical protein
MYIGHNVSGAFSSRYVDNVGALLKELYITKIEKYVTYKRAVENSV